MIVRQDLGNGYVRVYSDEKKKIVDCRTKEEYSEAIVKENSRIEFIEKD